MLPAERYAVVVGVSLCLPRHAGGKHTSLVVAAVFVVIVPGHNVLVHFTPLLCLKH